MSRGAMISESSSSPSAPMKGSCSCVMVRSGDQLSLCEDGVRGMRERSEWAWEEVKVEEEEDEWVYESSG